MVAGENAKAAGIIGDRFVKSELGREICDRSFDRSAGSGFPVSVLAGELISERIVGLLQFAKKTFVLSEFFQSRVSGQLQHAHRIMIGPVPSIGIEVADKAVGGGCAG